VRGLFAVPGVRRVLVVPAAVPPHKTGLASARDRAEMARLNFAPSPADSFPPEVRLDPRELERGAGRPSYTYETLQELSREHPQLAFVIGADQLRDLTGWYRFPELLEAAHWIVLERKPEGSSLARETLREWGVSGLARPEAGPGGWETWRLRHGETRLVLVPTEAPALSSTSIREAIGRSGKAPAGSLLPEVEAYMKLHGLYGAK
jgi:nicotinate-nucleotide adenylyltransferase